MAEKTNLQDSQLAYAKYLLEIAEYYDKGNNKTQQLLQQQHRHARSQSSSSTAAGSLDVKRGRASLQLLPLRHLRIGSEGDDDSGRKKRALQEEGIRWIKRLAKQGYGEAAYLLATMYDQEKYGLRRQPLKSFKLYEIAACAAKMPEALHGIATFHESQGNASEAVAYYKAAAEQGLVDSVHVSLHTLSAIANLTWRWRYLYILAYGPDLPSRRTWATPEHDSRAGCAGTGSRECH